MILREANAADIPAISRLATDAFVAKFGDLYSAKDLSSFLEESLSEPAIAAELANPPVVVLNFGAVSYINSTGIALIVGLLARARKSKRRLLVYGLSPHYQEIFQITRLADFMTVFQDENSALMSSR